MTGKKKSIVGHINGLFPNCREVTMLVVKEQEMALTFPEKIKLFFHANIVCKFCRVFRKQSGILHKHIHKMAEEGASSSVKFTLDAHRKSAMQAAIDREMEKK
jgi:hypothetical protein